MAAAESRQYVVSAVFVVELSQGPGFFLAELRPEQRIREVLRPQILDGLAARMLGGHCPDEEFLLRGNRHLKHNAVAGHVEDARSDHGRLPAHPNVRSPPGQQRSISLE